MAKWYYAVGTETAGPVDEDELRAMAARGELRPTTYVVPEGDQEWVQLHTVEGRLGLTRGLDGHYGAASPPAVAAPATGLAAPVAEAVPPTAEAVPPAAEPWPPAAEPWTAAAEPLGPGTGTTAPGTVAPGPLTGVQPPGPSSDGTPPGPGPTWPATGPEPTRPAAGPEPTRPAAGPEPTWPATGQKPAWPAAGPDWGAPAAPPAWDSPAWTPDHAAYGDPYQLAAAGPIGTSYASWGLRFAAKLIDSVIVAVPAVVLIRLLAWQDVLDVVRAGSRSPVVDLTPSGRLLAANLLGALVGYAYFAVLNGLGRTPGKMLVGIRVVRATDGAPIGVTKGLIRHGVQFAQVVPGLSAVVGIFVLVDAVSPLWDDRSRALHDRFAGSVVVRSR